MWQQFKKWLEDKYIAQQNSKEDTTKVFFNSIEQNEALLKDRFTDVNDVIFREIEPTTNDQQVKMTLVYIDSLIDKKVISDNILKPLLSEQKNIVDQTDKDKTGIIRHKIIDVQSVKEINQVNDAVNNILRGKTILLIDQAPYVLSIATQGWEDRAVPEPTVERTVRGPNVSFMENIQVNIGLLRRRIKSDKLKIESFTKGEYTQTQISVAYVDGIANSKVVNEVKKRIKSIKVGQVSSCQQVTELIEDNPLSAFTTVFETQRPDVTSAGILEGRVAILTDGCPSAVLVPKLFMENFISPEDYYERYFYTAFIRLIRFVAFVISAMLPALYTAVLSFHQEILPLTLVNRIYAAHEGVPFPIAVEMIIYGAFFESIREAGARIPTAFGSAITIVGALILGEAAISAGFLSADGVIIGALTGISVFLIPVIEFNNTLLLIRILFLIAGAISGFYGITVLAILITIHLTSLRSFGIPFMQPVAPLQLSDLRDFFMRVPYLLMNTRPESLEGENEVRQDNQPSRRFFFKYQITDDNGEGEN